MSETASNPDKRKRKSLSKNKTGCITCKIRHVKCDEKKPACSRCLKTGRQCDGYTNDGRRPDQDPLQIIHWQPNTLALHRISVDVAGSEKERRTFHFFRDYSALDFPGFFESSFWGQLVLQASHAEPSIRHAVIALGSLHENIRLEERTPLRSKKACDSFALQQCNKAIGYLNQNISSSGRHSKEILLMSCAIFICFEALQGNYESALSHMQGGLRIFRDWQVAVTRPGPPGTACSSQHHQNVDSEIVQMFSRLTMQPLLFPDTHLFSTDLFKQDVSPIVDSVPDAFKNLREARDCLDNCMNYKLQASVAAYYNYQGSENGSGAGQPQDPTGERLLRQWSAAFDALVEKAGPSSRPEDVQGATLLAIQYNCAKVLLSVGMPPQETAFDGFRALFDSIVSLATSVIHRSDSRGTSGRTGHFSFETGLVPPLYFTATRCRDPCIRRQALSLLSSTPRQECLWNSEMLSKVAERIILIEEGRDLIGEVTRSEAISVTSRLSVLNATIYSEKRQVFLKCCQQKCGPEEAICFLDEWIMY